MSISSEASRPKRRSTPSRCSTSRAPAAAAARVDARRAAGERLGPLAGVPIAVKDLIDQAGLPNTCGGSFPPVTPAESAPAVTRLEAADAVMIGRTGLHEFAFGFSSENHWFGPGPQPVGHRPLPRRIVRWLGRGRRRRPRPRCARHRHRRLGPGPGGTVRSGRAQGHPRPDSAPRRLSAGRFDRHRRPDRSFRDRRRTALSHHGR